MTNSWPVAAANWADVILEGIGIDQQPDKNNGDN